MKTADRQDSPIQPSRPPGLNARRKLANAATGSPKNITPKRENSRSVEPGGKSCAAASVSSQSRLPIPTERLRASSIMGPDTSSPVTWPVGPTRRASAIEVAPLPHPMSSTRSPGCTAASVMAASATGASAASICSCFVIQRVTAGPFQKANCWAWKVDASLMK